MCRLPLSRAYSLAITGQLVASTQNERLVGKLRKHAARLGPPPPCSTPGAKYFFPPYSHNGGIRALRRLRGSQLFSRFTPNPSLTPNGLFWI